MMSFQKFQDYIRKHILEGWRPEEDYEVTISTVTKNNGYQLRCLSIRPLKEEDSAQLFPVIYLDPFYKEYKEGAALPSILICIRACYDAGNTVDSDEFTIPDDYQKVRDRLVYRLVNYEKNREALENCPHVRIADLALTFRWVVSAEGPGLATTLVSDEMLSWWGVSKEELLKVAGENTSRMFPPRIRGLSEMLEEFFSSAVLPEEDIREAENFLAGLGPEEAEDSEEEIHVLTNESGINGASAMLYENVLKDYSDQVGSNIYILPSSIHEVLLVPDVGVVNTSWLHQMVSDVNQHVVSEYDYLSDSVYYYDRSQDRIRLAP